MLPELEVDGVDVVHFEKPSDEFGDIKVMFRLLLVTVDGFNGMNPCGIDDNFGKPFIFGG